MGAGRGVIARPAELPPADRAHRDRPRAFDVAQRPDMSPGRYAGGQRTMVTRARQARREQTGLASARPGGASHTPAVAGPTPSTPGLRRSSGESRGGRDERPASESFEGAHLTPVDPTCNECGALARPVPEGVEPWGAAGPRPSRRRSRSRSSWTEGSARDSVGIDLERLRDELVHPYGSRQLDNASGRGDGDGSASAGCRANGRADARPTTRMSRPTTADPYQDYDAPSVAPASPRYQPGP